MVGSSRRGARVRAWWIGVALPLATARGEGAPPSPAVERPSSAPPNGSLAKSAESSHTPANSGETSDRGAGGGPVRIEALSTAEKPPTFVMRGGPAGPGRLVFLHGMC